ncbi:RNA polymerase sigma factor [Chitinophaga silvatica]|uniref:RNA polymerase sigma factor n=1 Tax=Chitinophaga silvatica TaxID=2282649 RepID=A0A3E1YCH1_9BACT|nr:sigma-70 family RNA polymerase sigma factor [Chitinophaga silvatica]RFS23956.1 RNA polymerase sigma factor [Chitinophaga silvatica]
MSSVEFNTLLIGNADFLKPFALNLTNDTEQAKDLYQETMFKALNNQEKYQEGTNIRAWLFTIMRNTFINTYRKKAKYGFTATDLLNSHNTSTSYTVTSELFVKDIRLAVYQLPQAFRTPLLLHYEGYKYNEIAGLLDEPIGTIKSRIFFARKLLKSQLPK